MKQIVCFQKLKSIHESVKNLYPLVIIFITTATLTVGYKWLTESEMSVYYVAPFYFDWELSARLEPIIQWTGLIILFLSCFMTLFAALVAILNNKLSLAIRFLITAENLCLFAYSIVTLLLSFCNMELRRLNRFFACSFNGFYYEYTLKWPLVQVILPFCLRVALTQLNLLFISFGLDYYEIAYIFNNYSAPVFSFFTLTMDLVTARKIRKLRQDGKATRTDRLLTIQMLANSISSFTNYFLSSFLSCLSLQLYGYSIRDLLDEITTELIPDFFFLLLPSIVTVLCLYRRKEKPQKSSFAKSFTK